MAITSTRNEVKHGNRTTRAKRTPAIPRQPADAGGDRRRDSSNGPQARPAAGSASGDRKAAASGREAASIVELTIDLDDDRVIEAVANLLLDLTRHKFESQT